MKKAQLSMEFFTTVSFLIIILIAIMVIGFQKGSDLAKASSEEKMRIACQDLKLDFHELIKNPVLRMDLYLESFSGGMAYSYNAFPTEKTVIISLGEDSFLCNVQTSFFRNATGASYNFSINPSGSAFTQEGVIVFE